MTAAAASARIRTGVRQSVLGVVASRALGVTGVLLLSAATGAALGDKRLAHLTVAAFVLGAMAVVAWRASRVVFRVLLITLMLVPVYIVPAFHGLPLVPAVVASWTFVGVTVFRNSLTGRWPPFTSLDVAVALVFVGVSVDVVAGGAGVRSAVYLAYLWVGPYLAGRFAASAHGVREAVRATAAAAIVVVPIAIAEATIGFTVFSSPSAAQASDARWGLPIERLGAVRAQAAFGHPIALSMVLAASSLLALGMGASVDSRVAARAWQVVALSLVVGQAVAVSRTGWLVLGIGLLLAFSRRLRFSRRRMLIGAFVCVGVLAVLPQRAAVFTTLASVSGRGGDASLTSNFVYRESLLRMLEHPLSFPALGTGLQQTNVSVDNEFVLLGLQWGLVVLVPFAALTALVVVHALKARDDLQRFVLAAAAASLAVLVAVAFITQQQIFIWLLLGICGSVVQDNSRRLNRQPGLPRESAAVV
jgi:hypothetical protein